MTSASNPLISHEGATALDRALRWGVKNGILGAEEMERLRRDAPKGIRQIAAHLSTAHLRTELEHGFEVMCGLVNMALNALAPGDNPKAAKLLRELGILALSKEGNQRLKALRTLPEDTLFESLPAHAEEKSFLEEWATKPFEHYQSEKQRRETNLRQMNAARWLLTQVGGAFDQVQSYHAECVGRTALLALAANMPWPHGSTEFRRIIDKLATRKSIAAPANRPDEFTADLDAWAGECSQYVLPTIKNAEHRHALCSAHTDNPLTLWLLIPDVDVADIDQSGAAVTQHWSAMTDGRTDEATLLSLLLTVALGAPPKPLLNAGQLRSVASAIESASLDNAKVETFIDAEAPHPYQEALHRLWQSFGDEAESARVDGAESLRHWLKQEVRVAPTRKKAAG